MNKIIRLIEAERACRACHREPFPSVAFRNKTAQFTHNGALELFTSYGAVVTFTYDQALALSRWLVEMLEEERL